MQPDNPCPSRSHLHYTVTTAQMQPTYLHINKRATYLIRSALCQPRHPSGKPCSRVCAYLRPASHIISRAFKSPGKLGGQVPGQARYLSKST